MTVDQDLPRLPTDAVLGDRIRGCLLGGAFGDALGAPVEFMKWDAIRARFGPNGIQELAPAFGVLGAITDDTQMTLFTAEGVLRGYVRETLRGLCHPRSVMAYAYLRWLYTQGDAHHLHAHCLDGWLLGHEALFSRRAPGLTCLSALRDLKESGDLAHNDSKGCGGVMRVAPIGLLFAALEGCSPSRPTDAFQQAFELARQAAAITHGHPTGQLTAAVLSAALMRVVQGAPLRDALQETLPLLCAQPDHQETLFAINRAMRLADAGTPPRVAFAQIGEGWVADEALAIGIFSALVSADIREGVTMAVNHDGDSDSTGSIAGQLLGARFGTTGIPSTWLAPLELRDVITEVADDLATMKEWHLDVPENEGAAELYLERYPGW